MDGLIVKKEWLDLIISGQKTLEIRSCNTKKTGVRIYLLESGSRLIRGTCIIAGTHPVKPYNWVYELSKHRVDWSWIKLRGIYPTPWAWELTEIEPYPVGHRYVHPSGAVTWIKNVTIKTPEGEIDGK